MVFLDFFKVFEGYKPSNGEFPSVFSIFSIVF